MVKFLINRPVAVIMSFIAVVMLGVMATFELPVSLMPDINVPEITIQVSRPGTSVREMQNSVVETMRKQLTQVSGLEDLYAESRDGNAIIQLRFDYGTDIDMAFIDVSEKVDNAMRSMPKDMERPRIIKASVTDIPVFMLNVQLKNGGDGVDQSESFMELGTLCESVIKRRLEQLPDVALVDITGVVYPEVYIIPDVTRINNLGITQQHIESALKTNNISFGDIEVQEGQYRYSIRFSSFLQSVDDIKEIYLNIHDRIFQLKDIAEIGIRAKNAEGIYLNSGTDAVGMAIIKQKDAQMSSLKDELDLLLTSLKADYPQLSMELSQDQTGILNYTISNLKQSLLFGAILAFLVMFFFLKDIRSPLLIGFSVPTSLVISLLVFYLLGMSINIISLSGLILGVGMMIDNSIIVIDNITQYIDKGEPLPKACIKGTTEVIRPLLSSVLSTCAVFLPLVFLSGISGALFYDQAMAVTIGLFASLAVAVVLLPVLYKLFFKGRSIKDKPLLKKVWNLQLFIAEGVYSRGFDFVFRHRGKSLGLFFLLIGMGAVLFTVVRKEKLPELTQSEIVLKIDWNSSIHLNENKKRVQHLLGALKPHIGQSNSYIALQQFLLNKDHDQGTSETLIYLQGDSEAALEKVKSVTTGLFNKSYPAASFEFVSYKTLFDRLFPDDGPELLARVSSTDKSGLPALGRTEELQRTLAASMKGLNSKPVAKEEHIVIELDHEKLVWYGVSSNSIVQKLQKSFNSLQVDLLRSKEYLPIVISDNPAGIGNILKNTFVTNAKGLDLPVSAFILVRKVMDYKTLVSGKEGGYIPLQIDMNGKIDEGAVQTLGEKIKEKGDLEVQFSGKMFSGARLLNEMLWVFVISVLLLYFILAAQFESITQPLIVLLEIPIDIAGALALLYLFGGSLNLMSLIGIIVMCGIIINDSILKIDTINTLRKKGMPLMQALHLAGERRLKPILMTSITTVLALVPFLFGSDLGSELQKPLALAVIGGMVLGTLVSLYFIPLGYYYLYRNNSNQK